MARNEVLRVFSDSIVKNYIYMYVMRVCVCVKLDFPIQV